MVKPKVHVEIGSKVRQNSPTIFLSTWRQVRLMMFSLNMVI